MKGFIDGLEWVLQEDNQWKKKEYTKIVTV
jgi:hypothetical protein